MLTDKKRIQLIRLLFELSNFVAFGIPLALRELLTCRLLQQIRVSTFPIPLKKSC